MKAFSKILLFVLVVTGGFYFFQESDISIEEAIEKAGIAFPLNKEGQENTYSYREKAEEPSGDVNENSSFPEEETNSVQMEGELSGFIGKGTDMLTQELGEPVRKDSSSYGYESWIYTDQSSEYIQFAVLDGEVKMIFATGSDLSLQPAAIGQSYEKVSDQYSLKREVSFSLEGEDYRFQLNDEDMKTRPIVQLDENTFLQFYFDTFQNQLSSVRYISAEILLAHRPYEIYYRNQLPEQPTFSEQEWKEIQRGMEQQVFDLTNVIRNQYGAGLLKWDEKAAKVASGHSRDMYVNDYFSHVSIDGRGLKERLNEYSVEYFSAGENIAAQYTDGPAAVEGWLNSEGHREALLNDQYTHLGVGVCRYYYTQNFLQKS